jgi:pyruvate/2-oxoglutarate dehydrogenase complex dihydrolipoamide dehydrogenase (E3) component
VSPLTLLGPAVTFTALGRLSGMHRASASAVDDLDFSLLSHVRPPDWRNPEPKSRYDLVVLGGGTAGLVAAMAAAGLGARTALVERHRLGGDCLNTGCVPSKALIRSARAVGEVRRAAGFGVSAGRAAVDFTAVSGRMRARRASIAEHDSAHRLTAAGVDVFFGHARFLDGTSVSGGGQRLRFGRAVIATGGRPTAPPVPGLDAVSYLTNETVFELTELPARLLLIGAGPIGCELAQAFARFGAQVVVLDQAPQVLPREDPDAAAIVRRALEADGVRVELGVRLEHVSRTGHETVIRYARGNTTHAADAMSRIAIQNALFFGRKSARDLVIPWVTYTDPEVAHVGVSSEDVSKSAGRLATITIPLSDIDRAIIDDATDGFVRVHHEGGWLRGFTVVAPHAGEMIGEAAYALTHGGTAADLSATIHPYPTYGEALRKAGDAYRRQALTPVARKWLQRYFTWTR